MIDLNNLQGGIVNIEEIQKREKLSESSFRGTTEDYIYFFGINLPPFGISFAEGNVVYEVKKDGKNDHNDKIEKQGGRDKANPSLIRNHGSLFFVRRTVYKLTDGELCWRY